jgi:uncharacterized protein (UPF0218 family)
LAGKLLLDEVNFFDVTDDQEAINIDGEEDLMLIVVQEVGPVKLSVVWVSIVVDVAVEAGISHSCCKDKIK